jgi:hypothetical protein
MRLKKLHITVGYMFVLVLLQYIDIDSLCLCCGCCYYRTEPARNDTLRRKEDNKQKDSYDWIWTCVEGQACKTTDIDWNRHQFQSHTCIMTLIYGHLCNTCTCKSTDLHSQVCRPCCSLILHKVVVKFFDEGHKPAKYQFTTHLQVGYIHCR